MFRFLAKFLFYIALLGGAAYGVLYLYNTYLDQPLTPEEQAWLEPMEERAAPQDNGWIYALGFTAEAGADPHTVGLAMRNAALADPTSPAPDYKAALLGAAPLSLAGELPAGIMDAHYFHVDQCLLHQAELMQLAADNKELLERYDALTAYPDWDLGPLPAPKDFTQTTLLDTALLKLMLQAIKLGDLPDPANPSTMALSDTRTSQVLDEIEADLAFWRMALARGDGYMDKATPLFICIASFRMLSDLAADRPLSPENSVRLAAMCAPLSEQERDASRGRHKALARIMAYIESKPGYQDLPENFAAGTPAVLYYLMQPLYQPGHTAHALHDLMLRQTQPPGPEQEPALSHAQFQEEVRAFASMDWHSLRNPYGRFMLGNLAEPVMPGFTATSKLFNEHVRLLALRLTLGNGPLDYEATRAVLADSPPWLRDPSNGAAAELSPDNAWLSFAPEDDDAARILLPKPSTPPGPDAPDAPAEELPADAPQG